MTDNRTNEQLSGNTGQFTEAQVEAAAKALRADEGFMEEVHSALEVSWSEYIARLVLVAAQGAAPQAESVPKSSYISPSLPGMIRNLWKSDPSENSVRTALKLAGDLIQELIDLRAAPVLPSSGVDEDALAVCLPGRRRTMSNYTPTLEDAKRTYAYIQGGLDHDEGYKPFYQVHEEAFDRMIAEVERAAAARALEDAANERERLYGLPNGVAAWLRARAAEIREWKNDGES